jgi:hypothetical protein
MYYRTFPLSRLGILRAAHFPPIMRALLIICNNRSVAEMARILGKTPEEIAAPLVTLRAMQMIDARPPYKRRPLHAAEGRHDTQAYGSTLRGRQTRKLRVVAA